MYLVTNDHHIVYSHNKLNMRTFYQDYRQSNLGHNILNISLILLIIANSKDLFIQDFNKIVE